ncbi:hypothetical protein HYPSUDRAFT_45820 [Hypholoma sublateritium FD-334 SS-4]|uniref:DNA/RNA-binding protein Alba-like domain-containing protein n=1 Tax=Hypholoma sublateritium (strain FD-334 SS-4) TaxID=945553 RepID=A0A0D2M449_HYPSF|nr:hypothetical protein HYPSUDRAFT_45820 [Hypholoma sublateritium FD-334 SS-4]
MDSEAEQKLDGAKEKQIRIAQHGKMKSYIANALAFLETEDEDKAVVLHTLPIIPTVGEASITPKAASLATSAVPRLLSVVEILKREYISLLDARKSPRMIGLHQYNELGTLEALGVAIGTAPAPGAGDEEQRSLDIIQALSGKNHPRQAQTPFMRITLSKAERPDLLAQGATYQPPNVRKQSKSAKTRAKKRARAQRGADASMDDAGTVV